MAKDPFETQSENKDAWVGVRSSEIDRQTGTPVASEFLIQGKDPQDHVHIGLDEYGNELYNKRR